MLASSFLGLERPAGFTDQSDRVPMMSWTGHVGHGGVFGRDPPCHVEGRPDQLNAFRDGL
jgi:hypothetical protein